MSDGTAGVFFNNKTVIVSQPASQQFHFIVCNKRDTVTVYNFTDYDSLLKNDLPMRQKIELFHSFTGYLK